MKNKKMFLLGLMLAVIFSGRMARAEEISNQVVSQENISIAKIGPAPYDIKIIKQDHNKLELTFLLTNDDRTMSKLKYGVRLVNLENNKILDEKLYDEEITLEQNAKQTKNITYVAPEFLKGDVTLWVFVASQSGGQLGFNSGGKIALTGNGSYLDFDREKCFLTIEGEAGDKKYSLAQGVAVFPTEKLFFHCDFKNLSVSSMEAVPNLEFTKRSSLGEKVSAKANALPAITFNSGEQKTVQLEILKPVEPQAYEANLTFLDKATKKPISIPVFTHLVVAGESATIQELTFDKDSYRKGEQAKIDFLWSGQADHFFDSRTASLDERKGSAKPKLRLEILSSGNKNCTTVTESQLEDPEKSIVLPILNDCVEFKIKATLLGTAGKVLDEKTFFGGVGKEIYGQSGTGIQKLLIILASVLVLSGGIFYAYRKKGKIGSVTILFLVLASAIVNSGKVEAAEVSVHFGQNDYIDRRITPAPSSIYPAYYDDTNEVVNGCYKCVSSYDSANNTCDADEYCSNATDESDYVSISSVTPNKQSYAPGESIVLTYSGNAYIKYCGNPTSATVTAKLEAENYSKTSDVSNNLSINESFSFTAPQSVGTHYITFAITGYHSGCELSKSISIPITVIASCNETCNSNLGHGCSPSSPTNSSEVTSERCCGSGETCRACNAGYVWNATGQCVCVPTNSGCAANTCIGQSCWDGCGYIEGTKTDGDCSSPTCSIGFNADAYTVGQDAVVAWSTAHATKVSLVCSGAGSANEPNAPANSMNGHFPLTQTGTATCELTAHNEASETSTTCSDSATVGVGDAPPTPTNSPTGDIHFDRLKYSVGEEAILSWTTEYATSAKLNCSGAGVLVSDLNANLNGSASVYPNEQGIILCKLTATNNGSASAVSNSFFVQTGLASPAFADATSVVDFAVSVAVVAPGCDGAAPNGTTQIMCPSDDNVQVGLIDWKEVGETSASCTRGRKCEYYVPPVPVASCSASFNPDTLTAPGTSRLSWNSADADELWMYCTGPLPLPFLTYAGLSYDNYPFPFSESPTGTETCTFYPYRNEVLGERCYASAEILSPPPVCGNGKVEGSEQCDLGTTGAIKNGACPRTCSDSCTTNSCSGPTCSGSIPSEAVMCPNDDNPPGNIDWKNVGTAAVGCSIPRKCEYYLPVASGSASFSPSTLTAPGTSRLSWSSTDADQVFIACTGEDPINYADVALSYNTAGGAPFPFTVSGTQKCTFYPYRDGVLGVEFFASVVISSIPTPSGCGNHCDVSADCQAGLSCGSFPPGCKNKCGKLNVPGDLLSFNCTTCIAPAAVNGACGLATAVSCSSTRPSENLCAKGMPSSVIDWTNENNPRWTWSCSGDNGGNNSGLCVVRKCADTCSPECIVDNASICDGLCGNQSNSQRCREACPGGTACASDSRCQGTTSCGPCNSGTWQEVAP